MSWLFILLLLFCYIPYRTCLKNAFCKVTVTAKKMISKKSSIYNSLTYIGHIHQQIKKDKYFDNTFVQSYLYVTDHAEKDFADAGNVVKVKFEELAAFTGNPEGKITVYDIQGQPIEETTHDQWWPRDEEFEKVMAPYIEKHF